MLIPLGSVLAAALVWSIYWFSAGEVVKQRFGEEREQWAAEGLSLACASEVWGGFPFRFEFSCADPVMKFGGELELQSKTLLLVALAYAPWQVTALIDGPSEISGRSIPRQEATHQRIMAVLTYEGDGKARFSAEVPALLIPGFGTAGKLMVHSRPSPSGGTDVALSAADLSYQGDGSQALILDQAEMLGTLTPDRLLKLEKAELQQGSLRYWGSGTLSLDAANRISGQIDTETNDVNRLLDALRPQLQLSGQQLSSIQMMLGLLGNEAKAAIIAKDGILYVGPFAAAELEPLY